MRSTGWVMRFPLKVIGVVLQVVGYSLAFLGALIGWGLDDLAELNKAAHQYMDNTKEAKRRKT